MYKVPNIYEKLIAIIIRKETTKYRIPNIIAKYQKVSNYDFTTLMLKSN